MRLGLFGGMFDPPHIGHLMVMDQVAEALSLDVMSMIPCADPPHREATGTSFGLRMDMCRLSLSGRSKGIGTSFDVIDIEGEIGSPSYTWRTIQAIRERVVTAARYADLFLVMGEDEFVSFSGWKNPEYIVKECNIVCVRRPGFEAVLRLPLDEERTTFVPVDGAYGMSSTMIRNRLVEGRSIRYLVPDGVDTLIYMHGLYGSETSLDFIKRTTGFDIAKDAIV